MSIHPQGLRARGVLFAVAAVIALALTSVPADAKVVAATAKHGRIGYVPAFGNTSPQGTACGNGQNCSRLLFHSGGVVQHAQKLYTIYWVPPGFTVAASYQSDINKWIGNFATLNYSPSSVFSVAQQYYDQSGPAGATRFVPNALSLGGSFIDTKPYPSASTGTGTCTDSANNVASKVCLDQAQQAAEITSFVTAHNLPKGPNVQYLLFTPPTVGSCFGAHDAATNCAYTGYCAYHSYIGASTPANQIVWANEPWTYQVSGCDLQFMGFGAGYASNSMADPEFSTLSHEIIETMTDVNLNAWYDGTGNEIGDKCAYNYNGSAVADFTGLSKNGFGFWNQAASGKQYLMQYEYSNLITNGTSTGCVGKVTEAQPSATISPAAAIHGHAQTFTATVSAPSGALAYIQWNFGDGTPTVLSGVSISHTYLTAGTKTITAIVTDKHGNEKKVLETVTVS